MVEGEPLSSSSAPVGNVSEDGPDNLIDDWLDFYSDSDGSYCEDLDDDEEDASGVIAVEAGTETATVANAVPAPATVKSVVSGERASTER